MAMAETQSESSSSPAATKTPMSLTSNRGLAELRRIGEDEFLQTPVASPTAQNGRSEYFDFATNERTPRRSSTDPVSPSSTEKGAPAPKPRAATTYEPERTNSAEPSRSSFGNFKKSLRGILQLGKYNSLAEAGPKGHAVRRHSTQNTNYSASFEDTEIWDRKAILSLDGGGIRGYSALLIIKELMRVIGELETQEVTDPAASSYHPLSSAQVMATDEEGRLLSQSPAADPTETSPWLPCHYFDYMAGTSTGGLISIMLGRLRMNIDDCITDYEKLGGKVFARSRWFHLRSIPPFWFPREKYNHRILEQVVQEVVAERVPKIGGFPGGKTFAFDENRCRVVVISFQQQRNGKTEKPYLFRTYKNLRRSDDEQGRKTDRNPGPAHDLPIWQVARATSAAPTYFEEVEIEGLKYLDGGFGANNPSVEIFREVRKMNNYNEKCIGTIVSIGTGMSDGGRIKSDNPKSSGRKRAKFRAGLGKFLVYENFARKWATDSEKAHEDMVEQLKPKSIFNYYRFNVDKGLERMKLDEWRERSSLRVRLGRLVASCRSRTNNAAANDVELEEASKKAIPNGKPDDNTTANDATRTVEDVSRNRGTHLPAIPRWGQYRNKTLETIRRETETYLSQPQVKLWISRCARQLVDGRRGRAKMDPQRWEKACFSAWFQCRLPECPRGEKEYPDRYAMENHLLHKHTDKHNKDDEESRKRLQDDIEWCKVVVQ